MIAEGLRRSESLSGSTPRYDGRSEYMTPWRPLLFREAQGLIAVHQPDVAAEPAREPRESRVDQAGFSPGSDVAGNLSGSGRLHEDEIGGAQLDRQPAG